MAKKRGAYTQGKTHYGIPHALQMGYFAPRPPPTEPKFGGFVTALQKFFESGANFNPQLKEGGAKYRDYDTDMHKNMWNSMFGDRGWATQGQGPSAPEVPKAPPPVYQGGGFAPGNSGGGIFGPAPTPPVAAPAPAPSPTPPASGAGPQPSNPGGAFGGGQQGLGPLGSGIGMRSPHGFRRRGKGAFGGPGSGGQTGA